MTTPKFRTQNQRFVGWLSAAMTNLTRAQLQIVEAFNVQRARPETTSLGPRAEEIGGQLLRLQLELAELISTAKQEARRG